MTPVEIHNELLAGRIIKHLERRNFKAHYCATAAEAIAFVKSLMPEGSSVTWGGSQTIREMGLTIPNPVHGVSKLHVEPRKRFLSEAEAPLLIDDFFFLLYLASSFLGFIIYF